MPSGFGPRAANVLTALRVVLTPAFVVAISVASRAPRYGVVAVIVFAIVAATDVWDGRLARRWGSASVAGRVFDHFADIAFILSALAMYASLGLAPWWVPATIGGSFAFYALDSWARTPAGPPSLIGSRIGHVGGVCNYVLIGVLVCNNTAGIQLLSMTHLRMLFLLVPMYSAAAIVARLRAKRVPVPTAPLVATRD